MARIEVRCVSATARWSFVFAIPVAALVWTFDRVMKSFDDNPGHGLDVSIAGLFAIAWAITQLTTLTGSAAQRFQQATVLDAFERKSLRPVLLGTAIGMVLSVFYIFGPHLWGLLTR